MPIPNIGFGHKQSNQAELQILDLAELYARKNIGHSPEQPHRVRFFAIIYIEQGSGCHMVDFKHYPFQTGSVIFLQRDQVHNFDFSREPQGKVLLFTQAFLDQIHANMRLPNYTPTHLNILYSPLLQLNSSEHSNTQTLLDLMITEIAHTQNDPLIVMYLFSAFALSLHRLRPELKQHKLSQEHSFRFSRFFELIQQNFHKIRDANWYAAQINTTYKTLNHVSKLATGLTAKQLIDSYTIIEIKRQLVINNITSKQLAYDLGFEDASNFIKYFKKLTNYTPSQFTQINKQPSL
ncbi:AraC family transcriptional regulator [Echinimonas agarilytica]|uniref:Helix-turn-helix transcriptional regulator n=1 Tax=Echinimonas agarilytica TaxID=1215918 RepID=A0AA42B626_9GAMM|nr:helix-turn-helix transcriptional regulator [Echinimonas agarilytica]MCM2678174.1 helix-turn-helix transcriptional regulator [Echinimonas agarilytica]